MSIVSLKTELRQQMKLTPQLLQSIELLQMNSQELLSYLGRMAEENPTLELQDTPDMADSLVRLRQRAAWLDAGVPGSFRTHREDSVLEPGAPDRSLNSLSAFLCDQLDRRRLPGPLLALTKYMVQMLDEDGYLAQEDLDGLAELKIPQAMVEQALDILQSLEPAGVGARGLSECLVLQLSRQKNAVPHAVDIAARFLPELGRRHYGPIVKALGISMAELRTAEKAIAALEPRPGRAFQPQEPIALARPDVFVLETDGELQVVLNEFYLPKVSVSSYYSDMSRSVEDQEACAYLKDKLWQAAWLLDSLERRGEYAAALRPGNLKRPAAILSGSDHGTGSYEADLFGRGAGVAPVHRFPGCSGQVSAMPPGNLSAPVFPQPACGVPGDILPGSKAETADPSPVGGPGPSP